MKHRLIPNTESIQFLSATMSTRLLLLLCFLGPIIAKKPPDVECRVMNLKYVHCSWNNQSTPEVNYTFSSWFVPDHNNMFYSRFQNHIKTDCADYLLENNTNIGCNQPYKKLDRFYTFYTVLRHGNKTYQKDHSLKMRVKLNPPANLTVKNESDFNLWFYWNHTSGCVESQVRYRKNNNNWEHSNVAADTQSYSINFPSSNSRYELQVRSKISTMCGGSIFWSDWSEPVAWGFNNSTDTTMLNESLPVWTPVLYVVGAITLILLVLLLLQHERIRIILVPVVPKPSLNSPDIEDWFQFSKGLMKEGFKANYNEQACPVREYTYISRFDSNSSDTSDLTDTTDQTDCSVFIGMNESEDP